MSKLQRTVEKRTWQSGLLFVSGMLLAILFAGTGLALVSAAPLAQPSRNTTVSSATNYDLGSHAAGLLDVGGITSDQPGGSAQPAKLPQSSSAPSSPLTTTLTFTGSITTADPTQTGRLFRDGTASTCANEACPGLQDSTARHYDAYTFVNNSSSATCITVTLRVGSCIGTSANAIFSEAYVGNFDPASLCTNLLGDAGGSPNTNTPYPYSFTVPAGANFVVVVNEVTANAGCGSYSFDISLPDAPPTATSTRTPVATATSTRAATATATSCPIQFADVPSSGSGSTFYSFVRCLACRGIVSGYKCGGAGEPCTNGPNTYYYRPGNNVTRGQLSKIIAGAASLNQPIPAGQQSFHDVLSGDPFYVYIERLSQTGAISGYQCNTNNPQNGEYLPCDAQNRPWFLPNNNATRGQISKIVSIAAGFNEPVPSGQQTFTDVPPSSPFWVYIERLAARNIISGYNDAGHCGAGVPCFRYNDFTTRGQMAKIAANAFFPNCQTPAKP